MPTPDALAPEQPYLSWETRIGVLGNGQLWTSMLLVFGLSSGFLGVLVGVITKKLLYALSVPAVAVGGLVAVFIVVGAVIDLAGGFAVVFVLSDRGARSISGKLAKNLTGAAVLASLVAGRGGALGAALLATSEQNVFIPWPAVTKVKVKPGRRYIEIRGEWGDKPIGLYCTKQNFQEVLAIVQRVAGDRVR